MLLIIDIHSDRGRNGRPQPQKQIVRNNNIMFRDTGDNSYVMAFEKALSDNVHVMSA